MFNYEEISKLSEDSHKKGDYTATISNFVAPGYAIVSLDKEGGERIPYKFHVMCAKNDIGKSWNIFLPLMEKYNIRMVKVYIGKTKKKYSPGKGIVIYPFKGERTSEGWLKIFKELESKLIENGIKLDITKEQSEFGVNIPLTDTGQQERIEYFGNVSKLNGGKFKIIADNSISDCSCVFYRPDEECSRFTKDAVFNDPFVTIRSKNTETDKYSNWFLLSKTPKEKLKIGKGSNKKMNKFKKKKNKVFPKKTYQEDFIKEIKKPQITEKKKIEQPPLEIKIDEKKEKIVEKPIVSKPSLEYNTEVINKVKKENKNPDKKPPQEKNKKSTWRNSSERTKKRKPCGLF